MERIETSKDNANDFICVKKELLERHLDLLAIHASLLFTPVEGLLKTYDELRALLKDSDNKGDS